MAKGHDTENQPAASGEHPEAADTVTAEAQVPHERANFASLLLANPNHFGNLAESPFAPAASIIGNTTYEELKCVGYNPDLNLLKAVVWVKLSSGFLGNLCSAGSQEYVRFYISFDNGATWQAKVWLALPHTTFRG